MNIAKQNWVYMHGNLRDIIKADTDRTRLHNATRFLCFQK